MKKDEFLEQQIKQLLQTGSDKQDLEKILGELKEIMKKIDDRSPEETIEELTNEIKEKSQMFLDEKNQDNESIITALSTCIYLPSLTGEYKLKFIGGKTSDGLDVNEETLFDIASITKMYTLLLTFKLEELGIIKLTDKISDLDSRFIGLEDFTIEDIILLCGKLSTNGRVGDAPTKEKAEQVLETIILKSNDRTTNDYTDLGAIVLSRTLETVLSKYLNRQVTFDEIMEEFILKPFGLNETKFNPDNYNLAGNGNTLGLVHDPKSRLLGGAVGSAGIFTNSDDLAKLAKQMYIVDYCNYNALKNLVSKKNLDKMGTVTFPNSAQSNKGLLGGYQKHPDRENKWLDPLAYADKTFTFQGFTGAAATFDPTNKIHNNFLVGAIKDGAQKKDALFLETFRIYQQFIVYKTLELLIVKKYYEFINTKEEIDATFKI